MKRRLTFLVVVLVAVALAASLALRRAHRSTSEDWRAQTRGWWGLAPTEGDARASEELARQLSLPYAAGVVRATAGRFGVRAWDRERAQPGWNLYVSGHALEAVLMAMDGRILHRWRLSFAEAFPGRIPTGDSGFFRRARLLADGRLLALVQSTGLIELDADSNVLWRYDAPLYNDIWVDPDEQRILVTAKNAVSRPDLRAGGPILEDSLVTLDASGREIARASLLGAFERSQERDRMFPLGPTPDIFHTNAIQVLGGPGAAAAGPFARGNLLVSFREISTVVTLDPQAREVLWAQRGPWRNQHEPSLEPDGKLLLFDNRGGPDGSSRVLVVDPGTGAIVSQWNGFPGHVLRSEQAGVVHRLSNGDLLVVETERGNAWELDSQGQVVWEFASPHRAGARHELVAALFDVVRLERPTPFLESFGAAGAPGAAQAP